ncbi:MAG: hypothetical protein RL728_641 [Bacteroidota bacterium]|jgi:hypothetical protein
MKYLVIATILTIFSTFSLVAQSKWPKEMKLADGSSLTIYQPQPESLNGNKITGRAAVSVKKNTGGEPIFGAIFYAGTITTDKASRMAELETLSITNVKFSGDAEKDKIDKISAAIEKEAPTWKIQFSIDDVAASIKKDNNTSSNNQFNNDPPKIIYTDKQTTLVLLDGAPKVQKDKDLDAERVVNSPNLIFKEGNSWNLYLGGIWYMSSSVTEGWKPNTSLSKKLQSVNEQIKKQEKEANGGKENTEKPIVTEIIVATSPTELLQSNGVIDYKTIQGTSLLYVGNSSNEIFKDINSQKTYVLLAGRWYNAPSINGPWTYVAADKLPADFAKIPEGSEKDGVLANVAGTDAAEEAKIDAEIPQTAKVDRKSASIKVEFDGAPKFKNIEGTSLKVAENSNVTVMQDQSGKYFALDNGIWFTASNANGPWQVANERPKDVENIPASSSAYNTKYVYVYDSTPDVVYVGYTAGYMGGYVYGPTIVYGTGFYYTPWYGSVYYPRPVTWGFGFGYNPWTGWSMGVGFNVGFMHVGIGFGGGYGYGGGWFGPPMYRPPYRAPYYGGGYYGNRQSGGNTFVNNGNININTGNGNIYNNKTGVSTKNIDRTSIGNNNKINANNKISNNKANNVFSDKEGNVFQKDSKTNNWNQRDTKTNEWKPSSDNSRTRDLDRDFNARDRSNSRDQNFNNFQNNQRFAPANRMPASRPAMGGRGRRG